MNVAVYFSAGIGDAVVLIPLVKHLKKLGCKVTGVFTSSFSCQDIFDNTTLLDKSIILDSKKDKLLFVLAYFKSFSTTYLNFFANNRTNLLLSSITSKKIITNKQLVKSQLFSSIIYKKPIPSIHDSLQNLILFDETQQTVNSADFLLDYDFKTSFTVKRENIKRKYIVLQLSTGNNVHKYKNWSTKNWKTFIERFLSTYPEIDIILAGDKNETKYADELVKTFHNSIYSTVGKTTISEAIQLLHKSFVFIGLDGGLMHLAVTTNTPTFTLWGASNPEMYGYHTMDASKHCVVVSKTECSPCNAWLNPNTTRVNNPFDCPDVKCMKNLTPDYVFSEFKSFFNALSR